MHTGEEKYIKIPGFTLAYKEWGDGNGLPIIALHGWMDNAASFDFLAPLLPEYHLIAIDSPGFGHSSHRDEGSIPSVIDETFFILKVANALGWDKFILMGHSRGGVIAQLIACGAPERVTALILLDSIGMFFPGKDTIQHFRHAIQKMINQPIKPATLYPDIETATKARMLSSPINYQSAERLVMRGTKEVEGGYQWRFDRREVAFVTLLKFSNEMIQEYMKGIEAPTCVIFGKEGLFANFPIAHESAQLIKNHEIHTISGHHFLHMDDPITVANIIRPFLLRIE